MKTITRIFLSTFILLTLLFTALPAQPAAASSPAPYLVKDINPYTALDTYFADHLTDVNGTLFFAGNDGTNGWELWKSDGTAAGTVMIKDINPATGDSIPANPNLTNVNGTLFFQADDGTNGKELWKSDGTAAGTVMVKDINPSGSSYPQAMLEINGTLFFNAEDGVHASELWKSDGTAAGTVMVKDINPSGDSSPSYLTKVNGALFFAANDANGAELWKSDGTAAGTVLVKDINPGSADAFPDNLTNVNGTLFFKANDGTNGKELWKSDGSDAGTVMVKDINTSGDAYPANLINVNGTLFFTAEDDGNMDDLWKSDGTSGGTLKVLDVDPSGSAPYALTNVNGTLFFTTWVSSSAAAGNELWRSDGTPGGTQLVKDINPSGDSNPDYLTSINGALFFSADDGSHGRELWRSDGTAAGTLMLGDSNPGSGNGIYDNDIITPVNVNNTLFFVGSDGVTGNELWAYDVDTTAPTVSSITRVNPNPTNLASVDFTVTFSEAVTGVDISDFSLTTSGVTGAKVSGVSGSGAVRTVTVNTGSGNGTLRLDVVNDNSILNTLNNPLRTAFASGETYIISKAATVATFADVPLTYWASSYIERLANAGITGGCSAVPLNYCPDSTVTRAQMAVFLLRNMHGSSYVPPAVGAGTGFTDVPIDYWAAAWIKQLATEGITGGCGLGLYCPNVTVTRAQMAIFLLKAKHGSGYNPPAATGVFTDVPLGYWADKWIEQLAAEGVTSGCGVGIYCPDDSVTRAQMAVFLVKDFNLP